MQQEYLDRLMHPKMEYYRHVYRDSIRWNNEDLKDKHIIVYGEQGYGDIIQFARYISELKILGAYITLHCPQELHTLLSPIVNEVLDRDNETLPPHDFHITSMSLPFVLGNSNANVPYLKAEPLPEVLDEQGFRIGIAWEGNVEHSNNLERSCPLAVFKSIHNLDNVKLFMLNPNIQLPRLVEGCEDLDLFGVELPDFQETARLIASMNLIVSVDTSVLHLAGAMGQKTIALLSHNRDARWDLGINWYPTMKFLHQDFPGDWVGVSNKLKMLVKMEAMKS